MSTSTLIRSALVRTRVAHRPAPSLFIYPGLRSARFWSLDALPPATAAALRRLYADRDALLSEYWQLSAASASGDYARSPGEAKLHSGTWTWHSAVVKGSLQPTFALAAPTTAGHLQRMPDLLLGVPFAYTFFSSLAGGAAISPHFGPANLRLRVHIPLLVPSEDAEACGLCVGGETRAWTEPLIFDDAYEHSTWNRTKSERVVLLLDLWHPELEEAERESVRGMFGEARTKGWLS